jgi:hypothetical protein
VAAGGVGSFFASNIKALPYLPACSWSVKAWA